MTTSQPLEDSQTTPLTVEDIPGPKGLPVVGNMFDVPADHQVVTLMEVVRELGPMVRLRTPAGDRFVASGLAMIDDLCDDERFDKLVGDGQKAVRSFGRSAGLFTSDTDDPNWSKAHNILLPNFSQEAMYGVLGESSRRARELPLQTKLRRGATKKLTENYRYMESEVQQIIDERRRAGNVEEHKDLLSAMLTGVDKKTGQKLDDDNIVAQCQTFLIAGHETTSGLLSFAISFLIKHPDVVARAQEEVDRVLGTDTSLLPTFQPVQGLTYVNQILNETLRLGPTVAGFTRYPYHDTTGGPYLRPQGSSITALTIMLHRDPAVWGDDAEDYNPDHFRPETRSQIPPNAFKPFGSGQRACIGRQFAMQEAMLVLGMLLQRFDFVDYLNYQLKVKEGLTIKPDGLSIKIKQRPGRTTGTTPITITTVPTTGPTNGQTAEPKPRTQRTGEGHNTPLMVLFGSNLGTAEGIASRIAQDGSDRGYAVTLGALDDHTGELPHQGALIVVCASYNGKPPDNAERFCRWITDPATPADAASGLAFSVFGCGNMDWASTYQAVPTLIDKQLAAHGGIRIRDRGEGDARSDFDGQFSDWYSGLWTSLAESLALSVESITVSATEPRLQLTMENKQTTNPVVMSYRASPSTLVVNRELLKNGQSASDDSRSARHIE